MEYKIKKVIVTFFIVSFICHNSDFFLKIAKKQKNKKKSQICKTNSELRDIKWKFGKKILQFQVNILTIVFFCFQHGKNSFLQLYFNLTVLNSYLAILRIARKSKNLEI